MRTGKTLRFGYTTGTCAAAAARGAMLQLLGKSHKSITIMLPCNDTARLNPLRAGRTAAGAFCEIRKDAGDDPDITNGAVIRADVKLGRGKGIVIRGGSGVGTVTRPGLAVSVGEPAINPVPRRMIELAVKGLVPTGRGAEIVISVENGENLAKKTLNPRLGITGGISILGTTGRVIPYSHEAYRDSIRCCLDVAQAIRLDTVILSTGRSSEKAARHFYKHLSDPSFVLMGDYVEFAVREAVKRGMKNIVFACYPAKLLKIAAGALCTHVREGAIDLGLLVQIATESGLSKTVLRRIRTAHTVRHVFTMISQDAARMLCQSIASAALKRLDGMIGASLPQCTERGARCIRNAGAVRTAVLVVSYDEQVFLCTG